MGHVDCQFEVVIRDGRVVLNGEDVEEYVDLSDTRYVQRRMHDQERSATLAFRAGFFIAALTRARGRAGKVKLLKT